jgi:hypothetical protein
VVPSARSAAFGGDSVFRSGAPRSTKMGRYSFTIALCCRSPGEAYEFYLRGAEGYFLHSNGRTKASLYDTRRLLEQCLAIDPG